MGGSAEARQAPILVLSGKAMEFLNMDLVCRVYRQLGDAGMVMALQEMSQYEDKDLLAGHVSCSSAITCVHRSCSSSLVALRPPRTCARILQWDQALQLAETIAASDTPRSM